MTFDQLSVALAGLAILIATGYTAHSRFRFDDIPSHLPWAGRRYGFLADLRTRLGSIGNMLPVIESGYHKYSKLGLNFILPTFDRAMILVPSSQVKWIIDQPDNVLSVRAMQVEVLQGDYTFLDPTVARYPVHDIVIRRDLTRSIPMVLPAVNEELSLGMDECWGTNTADWVEIPVFTTMLKVVARATSRVFVGLPLCRNEEYLQNAGAFSNDVAVSAALIRLIPGFLKPLLAWIVLIPNRWHLYKASKFLIPLVQQRIKEMRESQASGQSKADKNDFTAWLVAEAAEHPDPEEMTPRKIVKRLMAVNFASMHTTTFTATNMLFDLFSGRNAAENVQELREEIQEVLSQHQGIWDKEAVSKLIKVDSAIRESLRISTFMSHGMDRMVISPDGITMQDGLHLPRGTRLGTCTYSIHHDGDIYQDADRYDPFRFSRVRESGENPMAQVDGQKNLAKVLDAKNLSMVTTSDTFLAFGHGRHGCPGRFFAAMNMKLLLAYIIMNYDIKTLESRPPNGGVGGSILPPMKATLSIKRRSR